MRALSAMTLLTLATPALGQPLGERGLAATFFYAAPENVAELVVQMQASLVGALNPPAERRAIIERAVKETLSADALRVEMGRALEKAVTKKGLERALTALKPELLAMMRDTNVKPSSAKEADDWLWQSQKQPDQHARGVQVSRIVALLPDDVSFRELVGVLIELMVDIAAVEGLSEPKQGELRAAYWKTFEPMIQGMAPSRQLMDAGLIAFRHRSLDELRALNAALESPDAAKLMQSVPKATVTGAAALRKQLQARLKKELAAKPK